MIYGNKQIPICIFEPFSVSPYNEAKERRCDHERKEKSSIFG